MINKIHYLMQKFSIWLFRKSFNLKKSKERKGKTK